MNGLAFPIDIDAPAHAGITKREYFMAAALAGIAANGGRSPEGAAVEALAFADACLDLLEGGPEARAIEQAAAAEAAQAAEDEAQDEANRAWARRNIESLYGWPPELGYIDNAPSDLLGRVACSQIEYENSNWDYERRGKRPPWEWRG